MKVKHCATNDFTVNHSLTTLGIIKSVKEINSNLTNKPTTCICSKNKKKQFGAEWLMKYIKIIFICWNIWKAQKLTTPKKSLWLIQLCVSCFCWWHFVFFLGQIIRDVFMNLQGDLQRRNVLQLIMDNNLCRPLKLPKWENTLRSIGTNEKY